MNNEFDVPVPQPLSSSWSDMLYLYCRAFIGWIFSFYNIYEVKALGRVTVLLK